MGDCVGWAFATGENSVGNGACGSCAFKVPIQERRHRLKETDRLILATVHIQDDSLLPALPRDRVRRSEGEPVSADTSYSDQHTFCSWLVLCGIHEDKFSWITCDVRRYTPSHGDECSYDVPDLPEDRSLACSRLRKGALTTAAAYATR